MKRRGFIRRLLGGAVAAPLARLAPPLELEGASVFSGAAAGPPAGDLSAIISETLRARSAAIAANVSANNALLRRLATTNRVREAPEGGGFLAVNTIEGFDLEHMTEASLEVEIPLV